MVFPDLEFIPHLFHARVTKCEFLSLCTGSEVSDGVAFTYNFQKGKPMFSWRFSTQVLRCDTRQKSSRGYCRRRFAHGQGNQGTTPLEGIHRKDLWEPNAYVMKMVPIGLDMLGSKPCQQGAAGTATVD